MKHSDMISQELERLTIENKELKDELKRAIDVDVVNCTELIKKIGELKTVINMAGALVNGHYTVGNSGVLVEENEFFALKESLKDLKSTGDSN